MPTLASKDSCELTLSLQTPEAHGAGHGAWTWWESQLAALGLAPSSQVAHRSELHQAGRNTAPFVPHCLEVS